MLKKISDRGLLGAGIIGLIAGLAFAQAQPAPVRAPAPRRAPTPAPPPPTTPNGVVASNASLRDKALATLTEAAARGTAEEAANAIEALIPTPGRLTQAVVPALKDPSPGLRGVAALAVGKAKLVSAAPAVEALVNDQSVQVRAAAIFALKRLGRPVDLTPLAEMLTDPQPPVRAQAAFVLGELGDATALPMLVESVRSMPKRADPSEQRLLELQIAEARVKLGDDLALVDIRAALYPARAEDMEATALAAQLAGQIRDRASVNQLITLASTIDGQKRPMPAEVRLAAAGSLARLGQPHGGPIALEYTKNSRDVLRAQAAFVLGEIGMEDNLPELDRMLSDPVGRVRIAAAAGILKITGDRAGGAGGNP